MAFRFDKLTVKAQEAVQRAQSLAQDLGNPQITPLHVLAQRPISFSQPSLSKRCRSWRIASIECGWR